MPRRWLLPRGSLVPSPTIGSGLARRIFEVGLAIHHQTDDVHVAIRVDIRILQPFSDVILLVIRRA